jgi:hypothetical protein
MYLSFEKIEAPTRSRRKGLTASEIIPINGQEALQPMFQVSGNYATVSLQH